MEELFFHLTNNLSDLIFKAKDMKNRIGLAVIMATALFSCHQASDKQVKDADKQLKEAKQGVKEARLVEDNAAKAKNTAEWNLFKKEADSSMVIIENELKKKESILAKTSKKGAQKLSADYENAKKKLAALKEELQQRNAAFKNDVKRFDNHVYEKNESFKREFKHDMNELDKSLKDLFKDNVK